MEILTSGTAMLIYTVCGMVIVGFVFYKLVMKLKDFSRKLDG